jgi:hypothetical protein
MKTPSKALACLVALNALVECGSTPVAVPSASVQVERLAGV